jgi:uncharacterized protein (TIGR02271 family)
MKTVIGLFERKEEAMRAFAALVAEGYARADLDILTNDDQDDVPKLARMHSWVPEPDVNIYLAGVRDGGTIVTANVGDTAVARAASILGSFDMVNIAKRASQLAAKAVPATAAAGIGHIADTKAATAAAATAAAAAAKQATAAAGATSLPKQTPAAAAAPPREMALTDPIRNDNVLEVIEEDLTVGKQQVERGRMRICNVVTEREVAKNVTLKDETIRVQRRPVNRSVTVDQDIFKPRSFEMVEMDEIAQVKKTARVVEEVAIGKDVVDKIETIKETLRRQDVQVEEIPAARPFDSYRDNFKSFYTKHLGSSGATFESLLPTFKFGHSLATKEPFRSSPWTAVEVDARRIWEERNPGTWDQSKSVVKYAWENVRSAR